MKKRSSLGPLPAGGDKYVITLETCLGFIQKTTPDQEQLKKWFFQKFPSVESDRTVKDSLDVIKNLGLIKKVDDKFVMSEEGERFLKTQDNALLYQLLDENYLGIHDIVEILYKNPQTLDEICVSLKKKRLVFSKKLENMLKKYMRLEHVQLLVGL